MTRFARLMRTFALLGTVLAGGAVACAPTQPDFGPETGGLLSSNGDEGFMGQRETIGTLLGATAGIVAGAQYGRNGSSAPTSRPSLSVVVLPTRPSTPPVPISMVPGASVAGFDLPLPTLA